MKRRISTKVKGFRTVDGAGVSLVRVLGHDTIREFDPILMLDSFDSTDPADYIAGFPMHPHRGIETISYISQGKMVHRDTLGNEDAVTTGGIQWMNSGSGIMHEEKVPAADRLMGVQLWLNLPKDEKMSHPTYRHISREEIPEVDFDGGKVRILAGEYEGVHGYQGDHHPLTYYDVNLNKGGKIDLHMKEDDFVMVFTLLGDVYVNGEHIEEKTAVKLVNGDTVELENRGDETAQVLYICSKPLGEPVSWAGPIVMNTEREIQQAFRELRDGSFIKEQLEY